MKWPGATLNERGRYALDGKVFLRNAVRDLLALVAALWLGVPLFEITLIYVLDALVRACSNALRIRLARGQSRGAIASAVFAGTGNDPKALAKRMLLFSVFAVLLCGGLMLAVVYTSYGSGDVEPLRALGFALLYTAPFAVLEHGLWLRDKRDLAVPHILSRDFSSLILFAAVMALAMGGALAGVIAFVLLRALHDAVDLVPSWSVDGVTWSTEWRSEWDTLTMADTPPRPKP